MKKLDILFPSGDTRTIAPVSRASLGLFSTLMVELQSIWIEEEFSTGDAIARDDAFNLMCRIWEMLPLASDRATTYKRSDIMELADAGCYEQLGGLFFGDAKAAYQGEMGTFDLQSFQGAELWQLHEVQPRKKLQTAYELHLARNQIEPSRPETSRSKSAATPTPTRSQTSSTALEKSGSPSSNSSTPTPSTG